VAVALACQLDLQKTSQATMPSEWQVDVPGGRVFVGLNENGGEVRASLKGPAVLTDSVDLSKFLLSGSAR
jgi:hypothetical protein